jgi:hypothetical protein
MYVYIVIGQFTETVIPGIHVSVHRKKFAAEAIAKNIGGVVLSRILHWGIDEDEVNDNGFKLWDDDTTIPNKD